MHPWRSKKVMRPNRMFFPFHASLLVGAVVLIALACGALAPDLARSQGIRETWAPNGQVMATAYANNVIYLGGDFSFMSLPSNHTGAGARIEYSTGKALEPHSKITGTVHAVEPDGLGGWYIGGLFTSVQGQPRSNLAHIDWEGNVTSWNPAPNGPVYDIASYANTLGIVYTVGAFSSVSGHPRQWIAGISSTDASITAFNPTFNAAPTQIEWGGADFYVGGSFQTVNGLERPRVAEFDAETGALSTLFLGPPGATDVTALKYKAPNGNLFIGYSTSTGYGLRAWNPTGFLPYTIDTDGPIRAIDVDNGPFWVHIGGDFGLVEGSVRTRLAAFEQSTGNLTSWNPTVQGSVRSLGVRGGFGLIIGGEFTQAGGQSRMNLAAIDLSSGQALSWDPRPAHPVNVVGVFGPTYVYVGGIFEFVGVVTRNNLAAVDATSGALLDWNPGTNDRVDALTISGNTLYVGGRFTSVSGFSRNRAAGFDLLSGAVTFFAPNVNIDVPTAVYGFAPFGNTVYMCGDFGSVGGVPRVGLAAVDATSGAILPWNPAGNGPVFAIRLIVSNDIMAPPTVFVGGFFTSMGGSPRSHLASLNGGTGIANPWNPNPNGWVQSLVVFRNFTTGGISKVYAGGGFSSIGGQARAGIAEINSSGTATAWAPNANSAVYAIATFGSLVYLGGNFTSVGGQPRNGIAAIDVTTGLASGWNPNAEPPSFVFTLLKNGATIYAGGTFQKIAGASVRHFAGIFDASVTGVDGEGVAPIPNRQVLSAPNPFEDRTTIRFSLETGTNTRVAVFDVHGALVRRLHEGWLPAGAHVLPWDGRDESNRLLGSGIYFARVESGDVSWSTKLYRRR